MDKAAVLAYCRVKCSDGSWVGCECCFTVVYDVMIVCTSIYRRGIASQRKSRVGQTCRHLLTLHAERALEAPLVRRIFSSSPQDPRYHMLSHISQKFAQPAKQQMHEPRAALFLNRFTRTLSIMYATNGIEEVLGIPAEVMRGRSFYYCIAENCLQDAIKCLEHEKGNDSIAYLRFWFRDPRLDDHAPPPDDDSDEEMTTEMSEDMSEGGVNLGHEATSPHSAGSSNALLSTDSMDVDVVDEDQPNSRTSSGDSTNDADTHETIFGEARLVEESSASSQAASPERERASPARPLMDPIELEAVVSCTSDGLVVCLRKARPMIPHPTQRPSRPVHENGLFAAPWAMEPMLPPIETRPGAGFGSTFAPSLGPFAAKKPTSPPRQEHSDFMNAIRDQAVFAWALTGINGALASYASGQARGEALPEDGLPVWASDPRHAAEGDRSSSGWHSGPEAFGNSHRSPHDSRTNLHLFGDPGLDRKGGNRGASRGASSGNGSANGHSSEGTPNFG